MILTNVYAKCEDCLQAGKTETITSSGGLTLKLDPYLFHAILASGFLYFECAGHHNTFRSPEKNHGQFLIYNGSGKQIGRMGATTAGVDSSFWPTDMFVESEIRLLLRAQGPRGEREY